MRLGSKNDSCSSNDTGRVSCHVIAEITLVDQNLYPRPQHGVNDDLSPQLADLLQDVLHEVQGHNGWNVPAEF